MKQKDYGFVELEMGRHYKIGENKYACVSNNMGEIKLVAHDHSVQPNVVLITEEFIPEYLVLTRYMQDAQGNFSTHPVNGHCKDGKCQIHSVKRTSDGEIFTIYDRARNSYWEGHKGGLSITHIREEDKLRFYFAPSAELIATIGTIEKIK